MRAALRQASNIRMKHTVSGSLDDIKIWSRRTNGANRQQRNHMTFRPISECLGNRALFFEIDRQPVRIALFACFIGFPPQESTTQDLP